MYLGVDINNGIGNSFENFVWEPLMVKVNALKAATQAACTIHQLMRQFETQNQNKKNNREELRNLYPQLEKEVEDDWLLLQLNVS